MAHFLVAIDTMTAINEIALFPMGRIVMTRGVQASIAADEILVAVIRHSQGDWGNLCEEDEKRNDEAMVYSMRLFSQYLASDGTKFWIITEQDRSYTTILLPNEY